MASDATPLVSQIAWIAFDPASQRVLEMAHKVAPTATTLLITGESGAGKDHLARMIHELGPRHDAPFLKIDCASLAAGIGGVRTVRPRTRRVHRRRRTQTRTLGTFLRRNGGAGRSGGARPRAFNPN